MKSQTKNISQSAVKTGGSRAALKKTAPAKNSIAILGAGNIGLSIAEGLTKAGIAKASGITLTRRNPGGLAEYKTKGYKVTDNNIEAASSSSVIILAVQPRQLNELITSIAPVLGSGHILISVVSGASIKAMRQLAGEKPKIVRAMPNTAIAIQESMTCLSADDKTALKKAKHIFDALGATVVISEELMIPATALCACGIAFFLRAIRAASQGGIEIGFHSDEALLMAAQTAKGAAALLLSQGKHPENEVDKVTTPRGCTISGLNQMEHNGFSSAMIKGIITSAEKAADLYS